MHGKSFTKKFTTFSVANSAVRQRRQGCRGAATFGGAVLGLIGALFWNGGSAWAQQFSFRTVALSGQQAPGTGAGVNYLNFSTPALNAAGQSAFVASITGAGVTSGNNTGIWSGAPGSVVLLARAGDAAPGTGAGINYSGFGYPTLNAAGQSAFFALLAGATSDDDEGAWSGAPGDVELLAREDNLTTAAPDNPTLNASGQSAFFSPGALWSGDFK